MIDKLSKIISWGRYLYWADICKTRMEAVFESYESSAEIPNGLFVAYASQWYASLYVIVEGWRELKLADTIIDKLLEEHEALLALLKRYRNGVFHFQTNILDDRFTGFVKTKDNSYLWARLLHEEFTRFFSDWLASLAPDTSQRHEIENSVEGIIGWIPRETFTTRLRALNELLAESEKLIQTGSEDSEAARNFRESIEFAKDKIAEAVENYNLYLIRNIRSIKS